MPLARTILGLVTLAGAAAPAFAQPPAMWPAPKGPNRLVFPAPPWVTHAPRTGIPTPPPGSPAQARAPEATDVSEVRFAAPGAVPVAPPPRPVVPAAAVAPVAPPLAPPALPPAPVQPRPTTTPPSPASATTRPNVWAPPALPGTTVPVTKGR